MGSLHSQNARISLSCLGRSGERSCLRMVGPIGSALVAAFGLKSTCANEPSPKRMGGICNRSASRRRREISVGARVSFSMMSIQVVLTGITGVHSLFQLGKLL